MQPKPTPALYAGRPFLFFIVLFLLSLPVLAQKKGDKEAAVELPAFGIIDKKDLEMKECDFDQKAEAVVLLDDGLLEFVTGRGMELKRRLRIKILSTKGLDWANVHLSFRSELGAQDITGLEAQTYNLDGSGNVSISKVDKKLVYEKRLNKKYSEKAFTFPDAKVGSVIEYKFKHSGIGLIDWYFQRSIPVQYSQFTLDFPSEIETAIIPHCSRRYSNRRKEDGTRLVQYYSMTKVPGLRNEPFIINEDYYRDRLETKVTAFNFPTQRMNRVVNWQQVIRYLMEDEDFGTQLKKEIPRTADLDAKLTTVKTDYDRMKTIYRYVGDNMVWNEYFGIWALDGVKSAWKEKKGTAGEINLILVNLLKDAGLKTYPILVSTHDNGVVNTVDAGTIEAPGFMQFNKVMAYVEIVGKVYVLDATQKNVPPHLIPDEVLLTQGLVIEKIETGEWGWKTLWNDGSTARNVMVLSGTVGEDGIIKGQASISSYDYARLSRLGTAKKGRDKFIEKYVSTSNPNLTVDDVKFDNMDVDTLPLVQTVKFSQPLQSAGEYSYFSVNTLTGLETNPFVADNRSSDIFFKYNQSYTIHANFTLPANYEFDALPKNIRMIMPDTSISIARISQVTGNVLQTRVTLDFKKPVYAAAEYAELQEFYARLFEILNEQFVVRKKK